MKVLVSVLCSSAERTGAFHTRGTTNRPCGSQSARLPSPRNRREMCGFRPQTVGTACSCWEDTVDGTFTSDFPSNTPPKRLLNQLCDGGSSRPNGVYVLRVLCVGLHSKLLRIEKGENHHVSSNTLTLGSQRRASRRLM